MNQRPPTTTIQQNKKLIMKRTKERVLFMNHLLMNGFTHEEVGMVYGLTANQVKYKLKIWL